ncbi:hypothetical protein DPMN_175776 [Dreissena polymorpha]|uniref:Zinc finger homeobox protein 4 n=1 Tax=Dreissena polymorpha TaxID=45954 RepID=A0A9D4IIJ9_DREPO|nr:hypothetical protein DPMN_175776 [Dreissena polymorpha]
MALESTSPFQGPTNSSGRLFADDNHVEPFNFAFPASATPVFNLSSHANTVLNVSHSTPVLGAKFDVNSSIKTFEEKFDIDSISSDDRKSGESASDISKCDSHDASGGVNSTVSRDNEKCIKFRAGNANVHDEESSDNEDLVECGNCDAEFQNLQDYMDHTCAGNKSVQSGTGDRDDETAAVHKDLSDVESFDGKIVYNHDGSAYIIEGDSDSELEMIIDFPKKEGAIVDKKGKDNNSCHENEIPHIDNAFFVPRNPNSFLSNPFMLHYKPHATPIMHSYRVYDLRSGTHSKSWKSDMSLDTSQTSRSSPSDSTSAATSTAFKSLTSSLSAPSVPTKPILMCFICKLSFGFVKSFMSHATTEHGMELSNEEKDIMSQKNSSAIIQGIGKDKEPLMSFLEPIKSSNSETETKVNCNAKISEKANLAKETTSVSYVYTKPKISDMCEHSVRSQQEQKQGKDLSIHDIRNQLAGSKYEIDSPQGLIANPQTKQSDPNDQYKHQKSDYNDSEDSNSQSSFPMTPAQKYMQDMDISSESPKSFLPPFSPSQRNYFGVCEDHPNGRAPGAECPSCDMILSSSQSLGGHMTMMHSRNSCKTLKCPKCNWHYKYQETLEIHMKEKHPEGDQKCMYCLTNQTHPRLARGESYSCGYKPYRCEVCNYSTTTKGNLSIHMQSDKHLNNVQDLANSGTDMAQFTKHSAMVGPHQLQSHPNPPRSHTPTLPPPSPTATKSAPPHQQLLQQYQSHQHQQQSSQQQQDMKKGKPKPTWRCDVCNYETNVARNLRIHMTSEKHTHNMMVLQQNMKHMQRDMQLHQMNQLVMLQQDPSFLGLTGPIPGGITFPYEGSMMMGGLPTGFPEAPVDLSKENGHHTVGPSGPNGPTDLTDVNRLFQCSVCNVFGTDSLESLHQHLQMDRTKAHEGENITVANGTYMCSLCQYKTTLKANFQLHCKTDKHIQRLQLVNHIKEGGATNEWRLKYLNVSNPIQVRCNCCDYYTNSIHKLQIHTGNPRHEASAQLFCHLQQQEIRVTKKEKYYHCSLCKFNARTKLGLMQHVHSVQHLHSEGLKQLEMKETGQLEVDIGDIFQVKVAMDIDSMKFDDDANTPSSNGLTDEDSNFTESDHADAKDRVFTPASPSQSINNNNNTIKQSINALLAKGDVRSENDSEMPIKSHLLTSANTLLTPAHHQVNNKPSAESLPCPLYQKPFSDKSKVHNHVGSDHHVKSEGFRKSLLALADDSHDMKTKMAPMTFADVSRLPQATMKLVASMEVDNNMVEAHWEKLAHEDAIDITAMSEKDVDDHFRCQTCSKSFVNIDQLYSHQNELGHLELKQTPRGPGYLCWKKGCNQYFKTAQALQMHFREIHAKVSGLSSAAKAEYKYHCSLCTLGFKSEHKLKYHAQLHLIKSAITCNLCAKTYSSIELLRKHVETSHDLSESAREQYQAEIDANTLSFSTFFMDPKLAKVFILPETFNQKSGNEAVLLENGIADSDKSSKDVSPCTTPASDENGFDQESMDESKEFMEDYMNSMAFAENSYEDPNRKFKCHRCKVAFTKQLYLSAHNKTIVHKKGEKFNYPIEKFMDPNRPYKCDVCMESFTQKNILLVHCNSVSHLHKMKQHTSLADFPLALTPTSSGPVPSTATAYSSAADTLHTFAATSTSATSSSEKHSSMKSREASPAEDDSIKPYKCNICKVSYSQGSTLDIHIRSVGHQTRASKLHELAMSGEIDLTRPLIEEPIDKSFQAQQQKMLNDFLTKQTSLSQQSMLFQGLPGLTSFPGFHGLPSLPGLPLLPGLPPLLPISIPSHMFPQSMALSSLSSQSQSGNSKAKLSSVVESTASTKSLEKISSHSQHRDSVKMFSGHVSQAGGSTSTTQLSGSLQVCHRCSAVFNSAESFALHQAACSINSSSPGLSPSSGNKARFTGRIKTAVQRNLLENFGFECVMQFNEFNQRRMKKEEESVKKDDTNEKENMPDNNSNNLSELENGEVKEPNEGDDVSQNVKIEKQVHLPEMNKSKCNKCSKQFSSVWVLKAHEEEVHKEIVPLEIVEEVGDKFKSDFEKKIPKDLPAPELPPTPAPITPIPEEKHVKQEMPPPPPPPPNAAQMQMDMFQMMFGMGMLPMSMPLMMNMNTQASMMPMMMPPPGLDMQSPTLPNLPMGPGSAQSRQIDANQKRARTRINDEQLKVLRGYFDINNSPSEEQIQAMSEQTGLPMKVIKHWFRNTLFKERQRNKDSPYNFSNPPSTTLDLEEYEKTGKLTIIEDSSLPPSKSPSPAVMKTESEIKKEKPEPMEESKSSKPMEKPSETPKILPSVIEPSIVESVKKETEQRKSNEETAKVTVTTPSSALTPPPSSDIKFSNPTPIIQQSIMSTPNAGSSFMQSFTSSFSGMSTPSYPPASTTPNSCIYDGNYSPPGGSSAGRRANRTRFTDYQVKCLQEYFDQNAYPKDDELEHLSKMLGLSPRVIVVWFQNARQKARKVYENQPAENSKEVSCHFSI